MIKGLLGVSVMSLLTAGTAFAAGTLAGTNVQNTFTLDYQVGGIDQPQIDSSGTPTEFTVDRLIDLIVASAGDTTVTPGALDQDLVFSVTNQGNDTQAYNFTLFDEATDEFDATGLNITFYIDDGDGVFEPGADDGAGIAYTLGAVSLDVLADRIVWVVVDGDIPSDRIDADASQISLVADTLQPTGGASPGTAVVADIDGINTLTGAAENVLADGSGTANEVPLAGDHSATGTYIVSSADLSAVKAVTVFSQNGAGCATIPGTPGAGEQYSVPGACVEYIISVVNGGATVAATNIAISDVLPSDLTFIAASQDVFTGGTLSVPATSTDCDAGACTVGLTGASLAASSTGLVTIRALVK